MATAVGGLDARPAQASPASDFKYELWMTFTTPEDKVRCLGSTTEMEIFFTNAVAGDAMSIIPLWYYGTATVTVSAKRGTVNPGKFIAKDVQYSKTESFKFTYKAKKEGPETVKAVVVLKGGRAGTQRVEKSLSFEVVPCQFKIHGSMDTGKILNAQMMPGWKFVGTYDIVGKLTVDDQGIHGLGMASLFQAGLFTGEGVDMPGGNCVQEPPWESFAVVEIEGDEVAWRDKGTLNLTFKIEPMSIGASQIQCVDAEGGSGSSPFPAGNLAAFTEIVEPVSASGGHTTSGDGAYQMDLVVIPEKKP